MNSGLLRDGAVWSAIIRIWSWSLHSEDATCPCSSICSAEQLSLSFDDDVPGVECETIKQEESWLDLDRSLHSVPGQPSSSSSSPSHPIWLTPYTSDLPLSPRAEAQLNAQLVADLDGDDMATFQSAISLSLVPQESQSLPAPPTSDQQSQPEEPTTIVSKSETSISKDALVSKKPFTWRWGLEVSIQCCKLFSALIQNDPLRLRSCHVFIKCIFASEFEHCKIMVLFALLFRLIESSCF